MASSQPWTWFIRFSVKAWCRARIDDLRRLFMARDQYVGQALHHVSVERRVELAFRQRHVALLERQLVTLPARQTARQNRDFFHAKLFQHPPCARRGEQIAFIVNNKMFVFADAQLAHRHGKRFRARQHVRQGRGVIGEGFDVKKYRARQMSGTVFTGHVTMLLPRWGHTRVNNLDFRIVAVLNQPVGGDKI